MFLLNQSFYNSYLNQDRSIMKEKKESEEKSNTNIRQMTFGASKKEPELLKEPMEPEQ